MGHRRGFTLVELLIVMAIIAVLIAILMPALSVARATMKQVQCLSNLHSIGEASLADSADHQRCLPLAGFVWGTIATSTDLLDGDRSKYSYYLDGSTYRPMPIQGALAPYLGQAIRADSPADVEADLAQGRMRTLFTCPDDGDGHQGTTTEDTTGWEGPITWTSYVFNEAALGWGKPGDGSGVWGHSRTQGQLRLIPHPSITLFLADGLPRTEWPDLLMDIYDHGPDVTLADAFTWNDAGTPSMFDTRRHNGRMNVLFMDGHAGTVYVNTTDLAHVSLDHGFP